MKRNVLIKDLKRIGGQLRAGAVFDANRQIAGMMPRLVSHLPELQAERVQQAQILFPELLRCMTREDYIGLADYFEYELIELFS